MALSPQSSSAEAASTGAIVAPPSLIRRLCAILYDTLLLIGILFAAALPLPLISEPARNAWWVKLGIQGYLLTICFLFFGWFWTHGGQTLGMRAWRLRLVTTDGAAMGWHQSLVRFALSIVSWCALGIGFLWMLWDRDRLTWHDRGSRSRLVLMPKRAKTRAAA